jgi:hypothetical protein
MIAKQVVTWVDESVVDDVVCFLLRVLNGRM